MKKLISMLLLAVAAIITTSCEGLFDSATLLDDTNGKLYYSGSLKVYLYNEESEENEATFEVADIAANVEAVEGVATFTFDEILFDEDMDIIQLTIDDIAVESGVFSEASSTPSIDDTIQNEHVITNVKGSYTGSFFALTFYYGDYFVVYAGIPLEY